MFARLTFAPTEVVPAARPTPIIRRLLRTTRLLELHGLADLATSAALEALMQLLRGAFAEGAQAPEFAAAIAQRGEFVVSTVSVQDGMVIAEADVTGELAQPDIEMSFRAVAALIAEEIANRWLRERFNAQAPSQAKLEFLELVSIPAVLAQLQQRAGVLVAALETEYRDRILSLPPIQAEQFASLQRGSRSVQLAMMTPERRVIFPRDPRGRQQDHHLFVEPESEGRCSLFLNGWEQETLDEERRRPDFAGFLRNLDRKRWSLSYAYEYNGVKAGFPDLLIFRNAEGEILLDVLEPHLDIGDSVAKAKGLARFARDHHTRIGRVEILRKLDQNAGMVRLRLDDPTIAAAMLDDVASNEELLLLFQNHGTRSRY